MSDPVILILISAALAIIAILYAVIMWSTRRSARYLMRAIGVVLLLVGLYITGLSQLLLQGVRALIEWLNTEVLDTQMWVGIAVGGLGLLVWLIGGFIKAPTRAEAKVKRLERNAAERDRVAAQAAKNQAKQPSVPPPPRKTEPVAAPPAKAPEPAKPSNPDDEVANILKKHGIE